jgi:hypothetical protein
MSAALCVPATGATVAATALVRRCRAYPETPRPHVNTIAKASQGRLSSKRNAFMLIQTSCAHNFNAVAAHKPRAAHLTVATAHETASIPAARVRSSLSSPADVVDDEGTHASRTLVSHAPPSSSGAPGSSSSAREDAVGFSAISATTAAVLAFHSSEGNGNCNTRRRADGTAARGGESMVPLISWARRYKWEVPVAEQVLLESQCAPRTGGGTRGEGYSQCAMGESRE